VSEMSDLRLMSLGAHYKLVKVFDAVARLGLRNIVIWDLLSMVFICAGII
jgi:hypothetical protein